MACTCVQLLFHSNILMQTTHQCFFATQSIYTFDPSNWSLIAYMKPWLEKPSADAMIDSNILVKFIFMRIFSLCACSMSQQIHEGECLFHNTNRNTIHKVTNSQGHFSFDVSLNFWWIQTNFRMLLVIRGQMSLMLRNSNRFCRSIYRNQKKTAILCWEASIWLQWFSSK